jgi:hypothetical protein
MRGMALQKGVEAHADSCSCNSCRPVPSSTASQELREVIARHEKETEQLTREKVREKEREEDISMLRFEKSHLTSFHLLLQLKWQEHMQSVLQKYVSSYKKAYEEAAVQYLESESLRKELDSVLIERDEQSQQILRLRAQVGQQQKELAAYADLKRKFLEYEKQEQVQTCKEIESRDEIIENLSSKLESALDQLELERANQTTQRRHVFFPAKSSYAKKH